MFKTLANAWKIPELRRKLLVTVLIVILYRLGAVIPVPYIYADLMRDSMIASSNGSIFQYLNILSGSAFSRATLFALSISPYITASIVIQLLTIAIPALERLSKEGEEGRKKLTQITRYVTVVLGLVTAFGYYMYMRNINALSDTSVFAVNVEYAYTHIAGICVAISSNCMVARRGSVHVSADGSVRDMESPNWFEGR